MKKIFKLFALLLTSVVLFSLSIPLVYSKEDDQAITILFTHDLHDHLYPFKTLEDNQIASRGGYARLSTAIKEEREIDPELLLIDAGDYSMGTLFQTIFASSAPELRIMGKLGYDVTTLGNHEFDFRAEGLADSLNAAKDSGETLPQLVASNLLFPLNDEEKLTPSLEKLKNAMAHYGVKDYNIIERKGKKIGIFGLMGKEADSNAPMAEVLFVDAIDKSKEMVKVLKNVENVDLIVCLSHSGTAKEPADSEDEILAKEVPEIDLIVSGHTHTSLEEPILIGDTLIASYGRYGENLGKIKMTQNENKRWDLETYELKRIDDQVKEDPEISQAIDSYKAIVQNDYLNYFKLTFDGVLAQSSFNFTEATKIGREHREEPLGNLICDSYIDAVKKAEGSNYQPIAVSVVPCGVIRDSFVAGDITTSQVFNVSSLGIGPDKISGYPLITVYLSGKELITMAEVDASITPLMREAQLYMSGLAYSFNPNRLIFDKVTTAQLSDPDGKPTEIEEDQLYRVVIGLYSAQMLSVVGDQSFGLLSIIPKTKEGTPITDFEAQIIYDDGHELKEWVALAQYLESFPKKNNIPQIPDYYNRLQGRKIVADDSSLAAKLENPNKIWLSVYGLVLLLIVTISAITVFFVKRKKRL